MNKAGVSDWYECSCGQNWQQQNGVWRAISRLRASDFKIAAAASEFKELRRKQATTPINQHETADGAVLFARDAQYMGYKLTMGSLWEVKTGTQVSKSYLVVAGVNDLNEYRLWTWWCGKGRGFKFAETGQLLLPQPKQWSESATMERRFENYGAQTNKRQCDTEYDNVCAKRTSHGYKRSHLYWF
jgi:hypothetical protein